MWQNARHSDDYLYQDAYEGVTLNLPKPIFSLILINYSSLAQTDLLVHVCKSNQESPKHC